jgi:hypothetical protein
VVGAWRIFAAEQKAQRVHLVFEAVAALVKTGREPGNDSIVAKDAAGVLDGEDPTDRPSCFQNLRTCGA